MIVVIDGEAGITVGNFLVRTLVPVETGGAVGVGDRGGSFCPCPCYGHCRKRKLWYYWVLIDLR